MTSELNCALCRWSTVLWKMALHAWHISTIRNSAWYATVPRTFWLTDHTCKQMCLVHTKHIQKYIYDNFTNFQCSWWACKNSETNKNKPPFTATVIFSLLTALRKFCINLIQNICDYIHVATSMDAVSRSRICHRECTYIHYVLGSIRVYYSEVIQSVLSTKRLKIHSCLPKRSIAPQHMFALLALSRSNESRDQIKQW